MYGLRVPAFVISPYAKRNHISHTVRDHTSVLKFIETKFNLGALTRRDANAASITGCLDFEHPGFLDPPALAAPGLPATGSLCTPDIPPPPTEPAVAAAMASSPSTASSANLPPLTASQDDRLKLLDHINRTAPLPS